MTSKLAHERRARQMGEDRERHSRAQKGHVKSLGGKNRQSGLQRSKQSARGRENQGCTQGVMGTSSGEG